MTTPSDKQLADRVALKRLEYERSNESTKDSALTTLILANELIEALDELSALRHAKVRRAFDAGYNQGAEDNEEARYRTREPEMQAEDLERYLKLMFDDWNRGQG